MPPAICSELSLPSGTFGTWGTGGRAEGELPKVEEEEGGAQPLGSGLRGAAGAPCSALGCLSVRGAGGGNKGRVGCSQEEPGWACCEPQMAALGLCTLPGTEHVRVEMGGASSPSWQLPSAWGGGCSEG